MVLPSLSRDIDPDGAFFLCTYSLAVRWDGVPPGEGLESYLSQSLHRAPCESSGQVLQPTACWWLGRENFLSREVRDGSCSPLSTSRRRHISGRPAVCSRTWRLCSGFILKLQCRRLEQPGSPRPECSRSDCSKSKVASVKGSLSTQAPCVPSNMADQSLGTEKCW